jgi:hypothetical protein
MKTRSGRRREGDESKEGLLMAQGPQEESEALPSKKLCGDCFGISRFKTLKRKKENSEELQEDPEEVLDWEELEDRTEKSTSSKLKMKRNSRSLL